MTQNSGMVFREQPTKKKSELTGLVPTVMPVGELQLHGVRDTLVAMGEVVPREYARSTLAGERLTAALHNRDHVAFQVPDGLKTSDLFSLALRRLNESKP